MGFRSSVHHCISPHGALHFRVSQARTYRSALPVCRSAVTQSAAHRGHGQEEESERNATYRSAPVARLLCDRMAAWHFRERSTQDRLPAADLLPRIVTNSANKWPQDCKQREADGNPSGKHSVQRSRWLTRAAAWPVQGWGRGRGRSLEERKAQELRRNDQRVRRAEGWGVGEKDSKGRRTVRVCVIERPLPEERDEQSGQGPSMRSLI